MTQQVPFFPIFQKAGKQFGVDPRLLMAVAKQESNFNPNAESHAGAQGVMQIMPDTGKALGLEDPFDAEQSIFAGAALMGELLQRFDGNVEKALAGYNWGPNRKALASQDEDWLSRAPNETQQYVPAVLGHMQDFSTDVDTSAAQRFAKPIKQSKAARGDPRRFFSDLTAAHGDVQPFTVKPGQGSQVATPRPGPDWQDDMMLGNIFGGGGSSSDSEQPPPEVEISPHPQRSSLEFPVPKSKSRAIETVMRMIQQRRQQRGSSRMMG